MLAQGFFYFIPMQTAEINTQSLVGFIDEIRIAKEQGWQVLEMKTTYSAQLIKLNEPKLVFTIGPVSNRTMKG